VLRSFLDGSSPGLKNIGERELSTGAGTLFDSSFVSLLLLIINGEALHDNIERTDLQIQPAFWSHPVRRTSPHLPGIADIFIALQVAQLARSKTNPLRSFEQMSNLFRLCQATPLLSLRSQVPDAAIESKPSNAWRVAFLPIQRWPQKKLDSLNCSLE